ncbi:AraC family transcriptional regulator [Olsenella sp. An290]|uniref:helix-turn-helix domain-containing protein n=1 Tax=Olsenella sp. An290 TaxID=1965625 RepID=UPI000B37580F|nr:AraC family transcriptional regulator [Olsenella sp. An290]OUO35525.1 hypothetical protein B5F84_02120 [Olsenella sp. An290]
MEGARVAAAVRQIVDETGRREPRAGRNVLMLAWLEGELDGLPPNPGDFDIISAAVPLGRLTGEREEGDACGKVFLALYFRTKQFVQSLMPIADEGSPLFRMLTTSATKRHPVRRVSTPDPDSELMADLFAAAAVTYVERRDGWEQVVEALGVAITALVSPVVPEEGPKGADEVLAVILQDIAARPESASLKDLARRYSYSTTYLSELIHERCGMTFTELVTKQRMERAAMLLRATSLPVREVARQVGYAGTSNFYRAFRAQFGCGPAEWREAARN